MNAAKEYLLRAWTLERDIRITENQIQRLRVMAERGTSRYEAVRVSGTACRSKVEDIVVDKGMADLGRELDIKRAKYVKAYRERMAVIDAVENSAYRQLLTLRYLCCMKWEDIAEVMGYSYVHVVHNLHPRALNLIKITES